MKAQILLFIGLLVIIPPLSAMRVKKQQQKEKGMWPWEVTFPVAVQENKFDIAAKPDTHTLSCIYNPKSGRFLSIEGDQLTTSINCHSNPQLWNLHENPNGEFMTLRNVALPNRALDVWHGYSVMHSN